MKVKMTEHYQDAKVHYHPEQVVEVDKALGSWLVEHRKAVELAEPKPVKHIEVEPQFEQAEEPPAPSPMFRKSKRSRGEK